MIGYNSPMQKFNIRQVIAKLIENTPSIKMSKEFFNNIYLQFECVIHGWHYCGAVNITDNTITLYHHYPIMTIDIANPQSLDYIKNSLLSMVGCGIYRHRDDKKES